MGTWVEGTQTSQIQGYWDEDGRRITFVRTLGNPSPFQVFTGYLFDPGATFCQAGDIRQMMAGSFEFFNSTGGKAARNVGMGSSILHCRLSSSLFGERRPAMASLSGPGS